MTRIFALIFIFIFVTSSELKAHEGHRKEAAMADITTSSANETTITSRIGYFHPILLHFPIALIIMTFFAELLYLFFPKPIFDFSARFMIIAAAVAVVPTILSGLALSEGHPYPASLSGIFYLHRFFGFSTGAATILAAGLSVVYTKKTAVYYITLFITVVLVILTGFAGGILTFGFFK